jgi:tRNA pseudouridine38-40 synthase
VRLAYNGQAFSGAAPQPQKLTAGGAALAHIERLFGQVPYAVSLAARTDAGVHAQCNYLSCRLRDAAAAERTLAARLQGPDSVALGASAAPLRSLTVYALQRRAMARACSHHKVYVYRQALFFNVRRAPAHQSLGLIGPAASMCQERLREAVALLCTQENFGFLQQPGCAAKSTVKKITRLTVIRRSGYLEFTFVGRAFLRKMIRVLVALLLQVGSGRRSLANFKQLLMKGEKPQHVDLRQLNASQHQDNGNYLLRADQQVQSTGQLLRAGQQVQSSGQQMRSASQQLQGTSQQLYNVGQSQRNNVQQCLPVAAAAGLTLQDVVLQRSLVPTCRKLHHLGPQALDQMPRFAVEGDGALHQHDHPRAEGEQRCQVVGDNEAGHSQAAGESHQERQDLAGGLWVEASNGLIEEAQAGLGDGGAGHTQALLHAAGQRLGEQATGLPQLYILQACANPGAQHCLSHAALAQREGDVVEDAPGVEQGVVLKR